MDPTERVRYAEQRFREGDVDGFIACFHTEVCIRAEPEMSAEPLANGRDELRARCSRLRARWDATALHVRNVEAQGDGVVADVLVVAPPESDDGGWRVATAIRFEGDLIIDVRAFWRREVAVSSLIRAT